MSGDKHKNKRPKRAWVRAIRCLAGLGLLGAASAMVAFEVNSPDYLDTHDNGKFCSPLSRLNAQTIAGLDNPAPGETLKQHLDKLGEDPVLGQMLDAITDAGYTICSDPSLRHAGQFSGYDNEIKVNSYYFVHAHLVDQILAEEIVHAFFDLREDRKDISLPVRTGDFIRAKIANELAAKIISIERLDALDQARGFSMAERLDRIWDDIFQQYVLVDEWLKEQLEAGLDNAKTSQQRNEAIVQAVRTGLGDCALWDRYYGNSLLRLSNRVSLRLRYYKELGELPPEGPLNPSALSDYFVLPDGDRTIADQVAELDQQWATGPLPLGADIAEFVDKADAAHDVLSEAARDGDPQSIADAKTAIDEADEVLRSVWLGWTISSYEKRPKPAHCVTRPTPF